jgi:diadenosine tetraphosphate (Ap4A) HIT family hydrolase
MSGNKICYFCYYRSIGQYRYNYRTYNKLIFPYSEFRYWYCALSKDPIEFGHALIIYKGRKAHWLLDIEKLTTDEWLELQEAIRDCKGKMSTQLKKDGKPPRTIYLIMLSETEPYHLHFHLIPNYISKDDLVISHQCKYKQLLKRAYELLTLNKNANYLEKYKDIKKICAISTNFGHWYLGLLEMEKNLKTEKANLKEVHEAAQQLKIHKKRDYCDK